MYVSNKHDVNCIWKNVLLISPAKLCGVEIPKTIIFSSRYQKCVSWKGKVEVVENCQNTRRMVIIFHGRLSRAFFNSPDKYLWWLHFNGCSKETPNNFTWFNTKYTHTHTKSNNDPTLVTYGSNKSCILKASRRESIQPTQRQRLTNENHFDTLHCPLFFISSNYKKNSILFFIQDKTNTDPNIIFATEFFTFF